MQQLAGENGRTRCYGRLLEIKKWGGGWIQPLQRIEHPSINWNRGHIYLNKDDMRPGCNIEPGDIVAFYLYADKKGLGAEDCFPVRLPPSPACPTPQAQAAMTAVAMAMAAQSCTPPSPEIPSMTPFPGLCTAPKAIGKEDTTKPQAPSNMPPPGFAPLRDNFSVNFALLADSDDDEDEPAEVVPHQMGRRGSGVQSTCGKSSVSDSSTSAGVSDDGTASSAGSDQATSNPTTPVPLAKCVNAITQGLEKTAPGVFSDDDDDEPAREPTPGSSLASSPKINEIVVPDPAGLKLFMI